MSRRGNQLFNLSFLDLLTSALGAIIFLFVITPKGGQSAAKVHQAMMSFDTTQMMLFGALDDSLASKRAGDTLFAIVMDYESYPKAEEAPKKIFAINLPKPQPKVEVKPPKPEPVKSPPVVEKPTPEPPKVPEKPEPKPKEETPKIASTGYNGDAPSVPAKLSVEINWPDTEDNVDLYLCKNGDCVYGGRKRDNSIGNWDSGKSRNRLFGNDLRTNQEAVRQFDKIIPGEYKIYARFKESKDESQSIQIKGLVYTKDDAGQERGETFTRKLNIGGELILIGTLILNENGQFTFKKS